MREGLPLRPFSLDTNQRPDGREPAFVATDVHLPVQARLPREVRRAFRPADRQTFVPRRGRIAERVRMNGVQPLPSGSVPSLRMAISVNKTPVFDNSQASQSRIFHAPFTLAFTPLRWYFIKSVTCAFIADKMRQLMNGPNQHPEQAARELIDGLLAAAGWIIQSKTEMNVFSSLEGRLLSASERAAVRADPAYEPAAQMLERIGAERAAQSGLGGLGGRATKKAPVSTPPAPKRRPRP